MAFEAFHPDALTLRAFSQENAFLFGRIIATVSLALLAACARQEAAHVPASDDFGDPIVVRGRPQRIVSLNPATTDLVFALGAGNRLVGRTHWDLYPAEARNVPDLGSGIRPNVEAVLGARPDLVLLYASNDNRAAASDLRAAGVNTLSLKIDSIAEFHRAARLIAKVLGDSTKGIIVSDSVEKTLRMVRDATAGRDKPRVFWHIWDAPLITIARGSYMNELLEIAGATNIYSDLDDASPMVSIEDVLRRNPDYIVTGPQGAGKIMQDPRWAESPAVKQNRVLVADTTLVGRPSVRLGEAAVSLARMFHPDAVR